MEYQLRKIDPIFWKQVKRFVLEYDGLTIRQVILNALVEYIQKYGGK